MKKLEILQIFKFGLKIKQIRRNNRRKFYMKIAGKTADIPAEFPKET